MNRNPTRNLMFGAPPITAPTNQLLDAQEAQEARGFINQRLDESPDGSL